MVENFSIIGKVVVTVKIDPALSEWLDESEGTVDCVSLNYFSVSTSDTFNSVEIVAGSSRVHDLLV